MSNRTRAPVADNWHDELIEEETPQEPDRADVVRAVKDAERSVFLFRLHVVKRFVPGAKAGLEPVKNPDFESLTQVREDAELTLTNALASTRWLMGVNNITLDSDGLEEVKRRVDNPGRATDIPEDEGDCPLASRIERQARSLQIVFARTVESLCKNNRVTLRMDINRVGEMDAKEFNEFLSEFVLEHPSPGLFENPIPTSPRKENGMTDDREFELAGTVRITERDAVPEEDVPVAPAPEPETPDFDQPVEEDDVSEDIQQQPSAPEPSAPEPEPTPTQPAPVVGPLVDMATLLAALKEQQEENDNRYASSAALDAFAANADKRFGKIESQVDSHDTRLDSHDDLHEQTKRSIEATDEWIEKRFPEHVDRIMKDVEERDKVILEVANRALRLAQQATIEVFTKNLFRVPLIAAIVAGLIAFIFVAIPLYVGNPEMDFGREAYLWFPPVAAIVIFFGVVLVIHLLRVRKDVTDKPKDEDKSEGN